MVAALFVPWCMVRYGEATGWRLAFVYTGAVGFVWLLFWVWLYQTPARHSGVSEAEMAHIHSDDETAAQTRDQDAGRVRWVRLFRYRQTLAFATGKLMTDGVWWFYLFWLPDYLGKQFGMTGHAVMMPTFIVYGVAIVGSIWGGSLPMALMRRGMDAYHARMTAMLLIAVCPLAVLGTQYFGEPGHFGKLAPVLAVGIICIGAAAHQAWSANLLTTVSDMFPKRAVASVVGIGTAAGGLGGVIVQKLAGYVNDAFKAQPATAYLIMFAVCGVSYLVAWAIMKGLVPRHEEIREI